jgi:hypothetical protein
MLKIRGPLRLHWTPPFAQAGFVFASWRGCLLDGCHPPLTLGCQLIDITAPEEPPAADSPQRCQLAAGRDRNDASRCETQDFRGIRWSKKVVWGLCHPSSMGTMRRYGRA